MGTIVIIGLGLAAVLLFSKTAKTGAPASTPVIQSRSTAPAPWPVAGALAAGSALASAVIPGSGSASSPIPRGVSGSSSPTFGGGGGCGTICTTGPNLPNNDTTPFSLYGSGTPSGMSDVEIDPLTTDLAGDGSFTDIGVADTSASSDFNF